MTTSASQMVVNDGGGSKEVLTLLDKSELGMRFICRRNDGNFWYVQIRVMVNGKRYYMRGKSFYDGRYGNQEASLRAALEYRNRHARPFFEEVGYEIIERPRKEPKVPKFKKRKEATSGIMANLYYIHLYKKKGKYTRCVVDVTVNVHGKKYHSTSYSYYFPKYGGKVEALKIAKKDRNKLAQLVHHKAMELNNTSPKSEEETKRIIKAVKIQQTPPLLKRDPDKFIRRSFKNDYWIVSIRKKIWGKYYRVPNIRFYDSDYGSKYRSKLQARKLAELVESEINDEFENIRREKIRKEAVIKERLVKLLEQLGLPSNINGCMNGYNDQTRPVDFDILSKSDENFV